ncbi:MAG: cellulose binding domain-containing protein [Rhodocyclaceae bacterium]
MKITSPIGRFLGSLVVLALAGQAHAVTVNFQIKSTSSANYTTDVVITNDTGTTISGWSLSFTLGNSLKSFYSANKSGTDPYTFTNVSFNGTINSGKTASFGFTANGTFNAANLANCVINGSPCTFLVGGVPVGGSSSSSSSSVSSSSSSVASSSSSAASSSSSSSSSSVSSSASSSVSSSSSSSSSSVAPAYKQTFNSLTTGAIWTNNIDSSKIKAHPENALITASCGPDSSNCYRVVYRHADGIHKQPPADPVFTTTNGVIDWTPSGTGITNTATDVTQANLPIDGTTNDKGKDTNAPVPSKSYTLTYDVYFEPGFDFAKGGKLPGLASKAFDSGCTEDGNAKRQGSNWSVRLMWRANGRVELYSYDQSRPSGSCGIDRMIDAVDGDAPYEVPGQIPNNGKFRFAPGTWYTIRLSVKVNDNNAVVYQRDGSGNLVLDSQGDPVPLSGNGEVSLAIKDASGTDKRLLVYPSVALRDECNGTCPGTVPDTQATWVNAVFFSTFFGGNETKRLTCLGSMPSYPNLTQARFDELCASQKNAAIFPTLTWEPQTPSAARFDNIVVTPGYTNAPF